jgi:hypothetical protein
MARPIKVGLDYFPFDVCDDLALQLIEAEFGLKAYAIYVKLLQRVYGGCGYYMMCDKDVLLLFSKQVGESDSCVYEIIKALMRRGIFNKGMYDKYKILTSERIQLTYIEAKRGNAEKINAAFSLIKVTQTEVFATKTPVNATKTPVNAETIPQRKEKESKGKYYTTPTQKKNKFINYEQPEYSKEEIAEVLKRKKEARR